MAKYPMSLSILLALACVLHSIVYQSSAASIRKQDASPCLTERENSPYINYLPECDERGLYKALQVSTDRFSCFTKHGIVNDVSKFNPSFHVIGPCKTLKQCIRRNQAQGAKEHKNIRCDRYGYFKPMQRTTENGKICVNLYGHFLKTSDIHRAKDCLDLSIVSAF